MLSRSLLAAHRRMDVWFAARLAMMVLGLLAGRQAALADLPPGWTDTDIGSPGQSGSADYTNGTWTVSGGGADIGGASDQFNFASEGFSGDGVLTAFVTGEADTDTDAKAGVMFRNDLSTGAMNAAVVATPGNGVSFQWRNATGGQSSNSAASGVFPPVWVRLSRSGNIFSAYYSVDSVNWTPVGSPQAVPLNAGIQIGLAVTAHNNALLNTASFSYVNVMAPAAVLTQRDDIGRTGQNTNESVLTLANVNTGTFGKLYSYAVDGNVYAQPLVMTNVSIPGKGAHQVVFVATEHDSVYAFEADNGSTNASPFWHVSFINPGVGVTTVPSSETAQGNISPEMGITSTPVIDPVTGTLYVEVRTREVNTNATNYVHRLHALDITTGAERTNGAVANSPAIITATNYPGTGTTTNGTPDNDGQGHVVFNGLREHSRPGLLLLNGSVYLAYASPGDYPPYHGWVFGYDARTLAQTGVFNTTPNGDMGGIWQAGNGLVADSTGFLYVETGNGTFDSSTNNYGDSILKLSTTNGLALADYFTPYNQLSLYTSDLDLGSGGSIVLPDSSGSASHPQLLLGASKTGDIYLMDRNNLGQYNALGNGQIVQWISGKVGGMWNTPAYFNGTLYYAGVNDTLKAFSISNAVINPTPASHGAVTFGYPGCSPGISANGTSNAIVWVLVADGSNGGQSVLRAYNATNVAQELYDSAQIPSRDNPGPQLNYNVPTVVNGKVYVGTANSLAVFGNALIVPAPTFLPAAGRFTNSVAVTLTNLVPAAAIYYTLDGSTPTTNSARFTAPLLFTNSATITAMAWEAGAIQSPPAVATFLNYLSIGSGAGLLGRYWSNVTSSAFTNASFSIPPTLVRTDAVVNFNWGNGSPDPSISTDYFTVRWTGLVQPQFSETYTFYTDTDDGARLWVNNQLLIDRWVDQAATESSGTIALTANQTYVLRMDYFENTGVASAQLSWSSPSTPKAIIPTSQLYPSTNSLPVVFKSGGRLVSGVFQLQLSGNAGSNYILEGSTDLTHWLPLSTNTAFYDLLNVQDPAASNFLYRFYRAVQVP